MRKSPITRSSGVRRMSEKKLKSLGGKAYSTITAKPKPIRKVNPKAQAKRKVAYRKMLKSPEYRDARAEALERAGYRCELWLSWTDHAYGHQLPPVPFNYTGTTNATTTHVMRCSEKLDLHAHHKSYPKGRKLRASDLTICCKTHHEWLESQKMHKQRMY